MNFSCLRTLRPIEWLLAALLLIAPFYFHPNIGGTGLRIPNNIVVWAIASIIGFYSLYSFVANKIIVVPRYFLLLLAFPLLAFLSGIISGVEIASQWTFRILFIWGGVLFLFGLFQYKLKQARIDRLLFIVVIAGLIHALIGLSQIIWFNQLPSWLPGNSNGVPTGLFQQINNQASFQVSSMIAALWLMSRPIVQKRALWRFIILLIAFACGAFIVSYSGSRVGALGFILALPLFLASRWPYLRKSKIRLLLTAIVLFLAVGSANLIESSRGLTSAVEKSAAINAGFSGSARLGIYAIAADVIEESPLFGHGIGSFIRVWQLAKPDFYAENADATLPNQRVAHPHNEIIFWLVEGGIIAGFGLLLLASAILLTLKSLPPSRRYAYAALLLPITLHTQVELPFYISASHWFVFLLFMFVVFNPSIKDYALKLSLPAKKLIKLIAVFGGIGALAFLSHSMAANLDFKRYILKQTPKDSDPFPTAMTNPYFKTLAIHTMMTSLLKSSMRHGQVENVEFFAQWGEQELEYNPHIIFYKLTIEANFYLHRYEQACLLGKTGLAIYPNDKTLIKINQQCQNTK